MQKIFVVGIISSLLFISCNGFNGKKGNGNVVREEISVGSFTDVEVSGSYKVYLVQDSVHSVVVVADENLQDYVTINEENGKVIIKNKNRINLRPSRNIKIYLSSPEFSKIKVSGAVDIYSENKIAGNNELSLISSGASEIKMNIELPKVYVQVSGAGDVKLSGETRDFEIKSSGASEVDCYDLKAENVKVNISGAGDAQVFASVSLDIKVSGAGSVKYKGSPTVEKSIKGAGSVKKVD